MTTQSSAERTPTHVLIVEVELHLVDHQLLDHTMIKDAITGVLSIARVAGRCGNATVTLNEVEHG